MNLQHLKIFPRTIFATLAKEEEDGPGNQNSFERTKNGDTNFLSSTNLFLFNGKTDKQDKFRRFHFQESQGKLEHPRLISVAEELMPSLLKPKSGTGGKLFTKVRELKAIQKRDETDQTKGKIDSVGQSQEAKAGHMVNRQMQMGKESVHTKPGKIANAKTANRNEVEKTPTASSIVKNKQAKTKG